MRRGTLAVQMGRFARRGLRVARAAAVFCALLVLAAPALGAQGTPAGTVIRSWVTVSFIDAGGWPYVYASDTVNLVVAQVAGADVEPPRVSSGAAGTAVLFAHTLTNVGNGPDSFDLAAVSGHGWPVTLYRDANSDGILDPSDLLIAGPLALGYGGVAQLLALTAIPSNAGVLGAIDTVMVTATSRFDPAMSDTVRDRLDVPVTPVAISLTKQVDRATGLAGDVLTYTVNYSASGGGTALTQLADTIPPGTSYMPGTLRWNGTPLTDAPGDDAGSLTPGGNGAVGVDLGLVAGGAAGMVTFQVQVNAGPPRALTNRGYAIYASAGTTDTAYTNAVQTNVLVPVLTLLKQLVGPGQALVGQQVHYTLRYGATVGGASIANTVLTDSLPAGLDYVSATPAAALSGSVLTWTLGSLAPGDSGVIDLVLQVNNAVRDTVWARNVGTLAGTNATAQSSSAAQLAMIGPSTAALGLDLTANALEAGIGEVIPYTVVVRNSGLVPISDIRIDNTLPAGGSYARGTGIGADSVLVVGDHLILVTMAPLAPGESRALHYAVALASATGTVAEVRAIANAQAGTLQPVSPQAVAWVQIRRAWPMETRAAIGKVWIDRDGSGVQQANDNGLAGVDIWTEDGQIATTDSSGKFSFANLRPGRHAFRLDSRTLPPGYRVAGDDIQGIEASGWTTPQVDFRVAAPAQAQPAQGARPDRTTGAREVQEEAQRQLDSLVGLRFTAIPIREARSFITGRPGRLVRYEVTVHKGTDVPLDGMVEFSPVADSAVVFVNDTQFTRYTWLGATAIPLPAGVPRSAFRIVAWSRMSSDSATATLVVDRNVFAAQPDRFAARAAVEAPGHAIVVAARVAVARDSASAPRVTVPLPSPVRDTVTVPLGRVRAATLGGQQSGLVLGTGINIFAPVDGTVLAGDRVYVGVKGEAGMPVVLYDGAKAIDSAQVRVDGVYDFVAVPLSRGPHVLRVRGKNSWGSAGWDSIAVHVTGLPAQFAASESRIALLADGYTVATANVRVLDAWGVPVVQPAYVTVNAHGAESIGRDADPSSVGLQLLSDSAGWLAVSLRPGRAVAHGVLELKSGDAKLALPLEILPAVRPLMVTGSGLVGVGASPDAYGAITARGRLGARTSLTLGLDSRRLNDGQDVFGRSTDPLKESQYPILGDASHLETRTASHNWFSARLERGFNWAAFGDLATADFARGLTLAQYGRSVTGLAARVTTGPMTWSGFGSFTAQSLRQLQIRGAGVSGPYVLGADVLPGTDLLRIETRDALNPERAVATQALTRFVDYEIDYIRGVVLFKQPIPAADASGNPLFIVATFEAMSGGEQRLVAGGRAALDVRQLAGGVRLDSLRVGVTAVNADQVGGGYRLVGGDVRAVRVGALDLSAEVAYAERGDSAGFGMLAKGSYRLLNGAWTVGAGYMRIDREFTNPANVALQPGLTELNFKSGLKLGTTELRAEHSSQQFALQGVGREHSRMGVMQTLLPHLQMDAGVANDQVTGGVSDGLATTAGVKAKWTPSPSMQLWAEGQRHLSLDGQELMSDFWGFGAAYRLSRAVALEAGQRFVTRPDSQTHYSVSSLGVRADVGHGTEAWGNYQLSGGINGVGNAALMGLRNRLQLTSILAVNVMFERRMGVAGAAIADPVRALPFLQPEGDYWSFAAGMELLPAHAPYRLSARGEYKDGTLQSSRLVSVAGDVAFDASLALLTRQQFSQNVLPGAPLSRQLSSLWGLAFRPVHSDRLNMLAKFQWTDVRNPIGGGVLVSQGAERRAIGAAEMIWTPVRMLEVGTRYAMRRTQTDGLYPDGTSQALVAWADYVGSRMSVTMNRWVSVRGDGRVLVERSSGATRWDASPSLALRPLKGLEIATGYRFGDLSDPDFSVRGGHGLFVTVSATLTEKLFSSAAEFWRARL